MANRCTLLSRGTGKLTLIDALWLGVLTRDVKWAGTSSPFDLIVNIDGIDVVSHHVLMLPPFEIKRGNAGILPVPNSTTDPIISFDSDSLTNSSVRVVIRGDNLWKPQHFLLIGKEAAGSRVIPLAGEFDTTDITLSTDFSDAKDPYAEPTMPLRLVRLGSDSTVIRRVLLLIRTAKDDDAGTDDPIELQIRVGGGIVLQQQINNTPQDDLDERSHN
jgi:hypothetical protein